MFDHTCCEFSSRFIVFLTENISSGFSGILGYRRENILYETKPYDLISTCWNRIWAGKEFVLRIDYLLLGGEMRVTLIIWPIRVIKCKVFELLWTLQHRVRILKFSYMIFNYYEKLFRSNKLTNKFYNQFTNYCIVHFYYVSYDFACMYA